MVLIPIEIIVLIPIEIIVLIPIEIDHPIAQQIVEVEDNKNSYGI